MRVVSIAAYQVVQWSSRTPHLPSSSSSPSPSSSPSSSSLILIETSAQLQRGRTQGFTMVGVIGEGTMQGVTLFMMTSSLPVLDH